MTFGYLGYIWAFLGCGMLSLVVFGSAALLYGVASRRRKGPTTTVEALPIHDPKQKDA